MKISIFSTKTCGYCSSLKRWLDSQSIEYTEYLVDQNQQAAQTMVKISGQTGVPFSIVEYGDGKLAKILGFDRQKFQEIFSVVNNLG